MADGPSPDELKEEIIMLRGIEKSHQESRDFFEKQYESAVIKAEEKELELEELLLNREEEIVSLK